jgi:hydrogenase-4 transcriptional activator
MHFARRACIRFGLRPLSLSRSDIHLLLSYDWPGNIRELGAVIDRAAILGDGEHLDVRNALGAGDSGRSKRSAQKSQDSGRFPTLDEAMRDHIEEALRRCGGTIEGPRGAAVLLGINPYTLRARMRKLGVDWSHFRMGP